MKDEYSYLFNGKWRKYSVTPSEDHPGLYIVTVPNKGDRSPGIGYAGRKEDACILAHMIIHQIYE